MSDFEIVKRPTTAHMGRPRHPVVQAVINSATTGHAVRFALNDSPSRRWHARLRRTAARAGFKTHARRDGDHMVAWAEKREG